MSTVTVTGGSTSRNLLIEDWCFYTNNSLTSVTFKENIANISTGENSFANNANLEYVTLPENAVLTVGKTSFADNPKLARVDLETGARVASIAKGGFKNCPLLLNAEVNELISNLSEVEGKVKLNEEVFYNCTSLENLIIPANVTDIYKNAFGGNVSLKTITVSRNSAPNVQTSEVVEGESQPTTVFGATVPNDCQIIFASDAHNNIASYRANAEFLRLLTKTLDEEVTEVNWVNQDGADVILKRNFESTWSSFVVPFAYTQEQLEGAFGENTYAAEYTFWNETTGVFRFTVNTNGIGANRPVLVKPKDSKEEYVFQNVNIVYPEIAPYRGDSGTDKYKFTGTYVKKKNVIPENSYFVYKDHFISGGSYKNHSKGFRTWLEPTGGNAPSILTTMGFELEDEDNEVTAINAAEVFGPEAATTAKTYYSLDGSRVEHPYNGIYIVNGKKVVIK